MTKYQNLHRDDFFCRQTLGSLLYFKFDTLSFAHSPKAIHLDFRLVKEHVLPAFFRRDETITFGFIEPLHITFHSQLLQKFRLLSGILLPETRRQYCYIQTAEPRLKGLFPRVAYTDR